MLSLNDLKTRAKEAGYNLTDGDFQLRDWPFLQAYLAFAFGIHTTYRATVRDLTANGFTAFDTHVEFDTTQNQFDPNSEFYFVTLNLIAGLNLGGKDTLTLTSNVGIEVFLEGKWQALMSVPVNFTSPKIAIVLRFKPTLGSNTIKISGSEFEQFFVFANGSTQNPDPGDVTQAVCGQAVCGMTVCGNTGA